MTSLKHEKELLPLSVVIATLGGLGLKNTLAELNKGPHIPREILLCLPVQLQKTPCDYAWSNVKMVFTPCIGQVSQRCYGFKHVSEKYVLQLDDDVLIDSESLVSLLSCLKNLGPLAAVAPIFYDTQTQVCLHKQNIRNSPLSWQAFSSFIVGSKSASNRSGTISRAGTNYGVDPDLIQTPILEVEWTPGGCLMHHRNNLITENFFPFPGKAFCEDLIHSFLLRQSGVSIYVTKNSLCYTEISTNSYNLKSFFLDSRARSYFVALSGLSKIRFTLWCVLDYFRRFIANRCFQ
jgi:GT2 family glycosyltransferase